MTAPAAFASKYPPSERTFRGAITMRLASGGADVDELIEEFVEFAADFGQFFPDDAPVAPEEVEGIVDEVLAEYGKVVTEYSPDALGLLKALDDLYAAGILYSYGDAFEASDAMEQLEDGMEVIAEKGGQYRGYLYSLVGDLDELVLHQRLEIAFGTFDADSAAVPALALEAVRILKANGLAASWSGDVADPIVVEPIVVDAPLELDDDDHDHDGHDGHDHRGHRH